MAKKQIEEMEESGLIQSLTEFLEDFRDHTDLYELWEEDELWIREELYFKSDGRIEEYDRGIMKSSVSHETKTRKRYVWRKFGDYFERVSKARPKLKSLVEFIDKNCECRNAIQVTGYFLHHILFQETRETLTNERISVLTLAWQDDLLKLQPNWSVKIWVDGIWLKDETVIVDPSCIFRKPRNEDLLVEKHAYPTIESRAERNVSNTSCIIELRLQRMKNMDVIEYLNRFQHFLWMFKVGNAHFIKKEVTTDSILAVRTFPYSTIEKYATHDYGIFKAEEKLFLEFRKVIMDFLPNRGWETQKSKLNAIYLAIDRYIESLEDKYHQESKITKVITCLEALFLKESERSELSHKLSQRTAILLEYYGFDPIQVYNDLKFAYKVRSTYLHGSLIKSSEKERLFDIISTILEYARISVIFFIEYSTHQDKEEILKSLDQAIISGSYKKELLRGFDSCLMLKS